MSSIYFGVSLKRYIYFAHIFCSTTLSPHYPPSFKGHKRIPRSVPFTASLTDGAFQSFGVEVLNRNNSILQPQVFWKGEPQEQRGVYGTILTTTDLVPWHVSRWQKKREIQLVFSMLFMPLDHHQTRLTLPRNLKARREDLSRVEVM